MRFLRPCSTLAVALVVGASAPAAHAARLLAPSAGIDAETTSSLDAGPWQYWHDQDTIAIAGHRTTHSAPFRHLDRLKNGDRISLGSTIYIVRRVEVIRPWQTWVLRWKGLVLSACARSDGSPTSLSYRIAVLATKEEA